MVSGIRFSLPKSLSCRFYKLINISGDCTYISPEECHFHGKYVNYSSCLRSVCGMVCRILGSFSSHMVFPVAIYKCESWTIKKAEQQIIEDEMVGWHHWLNGHEFEWAPGVGDGQGGLVCCSPWGRKELDTTERLNWTVLIKSSNLSANLSL